MNLRENSPRQARQEELRNQSVLGYLPGRPAADNPYHRSKRATGRSTCEVRADCASKLGFRSFPSTAPFPSQKKFVVAVVEF
jgi:hypothetical protein